MHVLQSPELQNFLPGEGQSNLNISHSSCLLQPFLCNPSSHALAYCCRCALVLELQELFFISFVPFASAAQSRRPSSRAATEKYALLRVRWGDGHNSRRDLRTLATSREDKMRLAQNPPNLLHLLPDTQEETPSLHKTTTKTHQTPQHM